VLVGSDDRRIDHGVFVVGIVGQGLEKILPNAALGPARKSFVDVLPVAKALGHVAPGRTGPELPDHRFDKQPVALLAVAANMAGTTGKQMFNARKLIVAKCVASQ